MLVIVTTQARSVERACEFDSLVSGDTHFLFLQELHLHIVAVKSRFLALELRNRAVGEAALTHLFDDTTLLHALVEAVHEAGC